jgi:predicted nucleic acid-binding Zn ribbon protein
MAQALPGALAELLRDVPLSHGKVDFAWKAAVGTSVERVTAVRLEDGVLIVEVPDQIWAREIIRSSSVILPRLQMLLGRDAVKKVEIRKHHR